MVVLAEQDLGGSRGPELVGEPSVGPDHERGAAGLENDRLQGITGVNRKDHGVGVDLQVALVAAVLVAQDRVEPEGAQRRLVFLAVVHIDREELHLPAPGLSA